MAISQTQDVRLSARNSHQKGRRVRAAYLEGRGRHAASPANLEGTRNENPRGLRRQVLEGVSEKEMEMARPDHETRVIDEAKALDGKHGRLRAFFRGETFSGLAVAEQVRLRLQSHHMGGYLDVLEERIDNFTGADQ